MPRLAREIPVSLQGKRCGSPLRVTGPSDGYSWEGSAYSLEPATRPVVFLQYAVQTTRSAL